MPTPEDQEQGPEPAPESLSARLRRVVENSDLSFYQIASRIGTSSTLLSMWMAGTARPPTQAELDKIEKLL